MRIVFSETKYVKYFSLLHVTNDRILFQWRLVMDTRWCCLLQGAGGTSYALHRARRTDASSQGPHGYATVTPICVTVSQWRIRGGDNPTMPAMSVVSVVCPLSRQRILHGLTDTEHFIFTIISCWYTCRIIKSVVTRHVFRCHNGKKWWARPKELTVLPAP